MKLNRLNRISINFFVIWYSSPVYKTSRKIQKSLAFGILGWSYKSIGQVLDTLSHST